MNRRLTHLVLLLLLTAFANPAWAWNEVGHLTIARIAWEQLDATQREAVVGVLRQHPHCEQLLLKERPQEATPEEWMFLRAASWSDYIRPPRNMSRNQISSHPVHRFHRGPWHYVNFPYRAGQSESALPPEPIIGEGIYATHILEQLHVCMKVLSDKTSTDSGREADVTDDQNRAIRLCWLFHLVGDLHQPLHVGTLVDETRFPGVAHSDLGGNLVIIRTHIGAPPLTIRRAQCSNRLVFVYRHHQVYSGAPDCRVLWAIKAGLDSTHCLICSQSNNRRNSVAVNANDGGADIEGQFLSNE